MFLLHGFDLGRNVRHLQEHGGRSSLFGGGDNLNGFGGFSQTFGLQIDVDTANFIVHAHVVVHNVDFEDHVVHGGNVFKDKDFVVFWVESVALLGGLFAAVALVEHELVLFEFEFQVGIRASHTVAITETGNFFEHDSQDTHIVVVFVVSVWRA